MMLFQCANLSRNSMQFISSDTNVWIDFFTIQQLDMPFRLPYKYIMSQDAINDEFISPPDLGHQLISHGLIPIEITIEEFFLAEHYGNLYKKLSIYDRIALAIAKCRQIMLLTGDNALRKAARDENVQVIGTLGILDRLWQQKLITSSELINILQKLLEINGTTIRLPEKEIASRLENMSI